MKHSFPARTAGRRWLLLFMACVLQIICHAQGITVYSDTTAVLEDAATDTAWNQPASSVPSGFLTEELIGNDGILDLLSGMIGLTGVFLILFAVLIFLFPLLVVGLIIYLIYRSNREKKREIERRAYNPERKATDEDTRDRLLKQAAVKYACWGVGCIVVEWIIQLTSLLHVVGVILLCIAAGDWLTAQIGRKKRQDRHQKPQE